MDQECRHPTLGEERDPQVPHGRDEIALGRTNVRKVASSHEKEKGARVHVGEKDN